MFYSLLVDSSVLLKSLLSLTSLLIGWKFSREAIFVRSCQNYRGFKFWQRDTLERDGKEMSLKIKIGC